MDAPGLADGDPTSIAVRDGFRQVYSTLAYDLVLPRIHRRLADAVVASGNPAITDSLITGSEWNRLVDDRLADPLGDSSLDGLIGAGLAIGLMSLGASAFMGAVNEERDSVYTFGDFLRSQIEDWFQGGLNAGWSPGDFTEQVESFKSPLSQARADLGARVNEAAALNAGLHAGLLELYRPDPAGGDVADDGTQRVAALTWMTRRDDRVRDAHAAVDRDIVPIGQPFLMGDATGVYEARFPGDPRLPIGLRINCRCLLGYIDGAQVRRAVYGTRRELLERAKDLGIRGRHSMSKPELQMAVMKQLCMQGLASGPDCPDLLDQMNRTALLTLARTEGIRGRYGMNRQQLIEALSGRLTPSSPLRTALGYATPVEITEAQRRATAMRRRTPPATGSGNLPRPELRHGQRGDVFAEFGGTARGYVPCVHCGLRLGATRDTGMAVLVPEPIIPWANGGTLNVKNLLPTCAGCFRANGGRGVVASGIPAQETESFVEFAPGRRKGDGATYVGTTVRALAIGAESTPDGERTVTIEDAPIEIIQLGVLHALHVAALDYTAYTVNGIPVEPGSVQPISQSEVMTFATVRLPELERPAARPVAGGESFDGTVEDVDAMLDLTASHARLARYAARRRNVTFHASHDQSTHGNWASGRDAPGGGVPVSGYVDYTEVDGVGGSFDVTPGYGPNVARFDWKDDVLDALDPSRLEAAHDTTMEVHFVTDADGNILEANATWVSDDGTYESHFDADQAAIAAFEAHFEALGIDTRAPERREYVRVPEIGEEGWVPKSALGTVFEGKTFSVGDEVYTINVHSEYADEWDGSDSDGYADGTIKGNIFDSNGNAVGSFGRSLSGGELSNQSLNIYDEGKGIGTAFLNATEGALSSEGLASTVSVQAVSVGRYAWAARGYAYTGSPDGYHAPKVWIEDARNYYYDGDSDDHTVTDPEKWEQLNDLEAAWESRNDHIFPIDLVGIDPQLKNVLLDGPSWYGYKDIDTVERPEEWALLPFDTFHASHNQASHGNWASDETIAIGADKYSKTPPENRPTGPAEWFAPPDEIAAAVELANTKARDVPQPSDAQIAKNAAVERRYREEGGRPGGDLRGNSYTRRARAEALFVEFGGHERGYCPCTGCGIKVSPAGRGGHASMQQDKILTTKEGGTYGTAKSFPNVVPACGGCNNSRGNTLHEVRPAWEADPSLFDTIAASGALSTATGYPFGWDDPLADVFNAPVHGEYTTRIVDAWFGTYTQHVIGGEVVDPDTVVADTGEFATIPGLAEFQSGMPAGLKSYWLGPKGYAKVGWGEKGSFYRCVAHLREHVGDDAEGTCANLFHEATGRWPGTKVEAALSTIELRVPHSELTDLADMVVAGTSIAVPRTLAASIVELVDSDLADPVDLTVLSIEDSRFFSVVATNRLARDDMPQIPNELLAEFRTSLAESGIMSWSEDTDPLSVFATQHELDARKVAYMIGAIRAGELDPTDVPILVSSDDRLLDGHHRWAAEVLLVGEYAHTTTTVRFAASIASLLRLANDFALAHGIESKAHGMTANRVEFHASHDQSSHGNWARGGSRWAQDGSIVTPSTPAEVAERLVSRFVPSRARRAKKHQLDDLASVYELVGTARNKPKVVSSEELDALRAQGYERANVLGSDKELRAFVDGDTHAPRLGVRGNGTLAFGGNPNRPTLRAVLDRSAVIENERDALQALQSGRRSARNLSSREGLARELGERLGSGVMDRMDHGTFAALRGVQVIRSVSIYGGDTPYVVLDRGALFTDRSRVEPTDFRSPTPSGLPIEPLRSPKYIPPPRFTLPKVTLEFAQDPAIPALIEDQVDWIAEHYATLVPHSDATVDEWVTILNALLTGGPRSIKAPLSALFEAACAASDIVVTDAP